MLAHFDVMLSMFKIHENEDGSTSIFCNKTGRLICKIKGHQNNSMGLGCRPLNVVETSPKTRSYCCNVDLKSKCEPDVSCVSNTRDENDAGKKDNKKYGVSVTWDEPMVDFSDDCITTDDFARCLNLVPKEKLKNESIECLKSSFPIRQISKTNELTLPVDVRDSKVQDRYLPLVSSAGVKSLNLNKSKNYYCDQTVEMKIKNYDSFCRFQLNTSSVCSYFPKLRCREKKEYPINSPQGFLGYASAHMYTFNKKQRLEKLLTLKTGLDTRSRRLLQKCNNRLAVSIKRLTPKEIDAWPHMSSKIGPITADCIEGEESSSTLFTGSYSNSIQTKPNSFLFFDLGNSSSDSSDSSDTDDPSVKFRLDSDKPPVKNHLQKKAVSFKEVLNSSKPRLSPVKVINRNNQYSNLRIKLQRYKNPYVKVTNVLDRIQRHLGDYYVVGTNVRVPFFEDFLNSVDHKGLQGIPEFKHITKPSSNYSHYQPLSQDKKFNSQCLTLIHKTPPKNVKKLFKGNNCVGSRSNLNGKFNCAKSSNSLRSVINQTVSRSDDVDVIDLTDDSPPHPTLSVKEMKHVQKGNVLNWKFHCYGCDFKQSSMLESAAYSLATQHLKVFHCVADIKSFLNVNTSQSGVILEAFPGYKASL